MYFCGREEDNGKEAILCWSWECAWWQPSCSNFPPPQCLAFSSHYPAPRIRVYQRLIFCLFTWGNPQSNSGTSNLKQILVERLFSPEFIKNNVEERKLIQVERWWKLCLISLQITEGSKPLIDVLIFLPILTQCHHTGRNIYFADQKYFDPTPKWLLQLFCV